MDTEVRREQKRLAQKRYYKKNREQCIAGSKSCNQKRRPEMLEYFKDRYQTKREELLKEKKDNYQMRDKPNHQRWVFKNVCSWLKFFKDEGLDRCSICGYDKCFAAIDFHHNNSQEKIVQVSALIRRPISLKSIEEVRKCTPLCANCHREWHHGSGVV